MTLTNFSGAAAPAAAPLTAPSTVTVVPISRDAPRPTAVRIADVWRHFGERAVLQGVDLEIPAGQFVALLGASGSGKTTLLRLMSGLDAPDAGNILVPATRTTIFQEPRLMPAWRVWRNVVVGARSRSDRERALAALEEVGLTARADAWPSTLSGGEAQRVALARALVRDPDLLLLDEPFAALDALTRARMQTLVRQLCDRHGLASLIVTHDVDEAILLADRILVLRAGRIHVDMMRPTGPFDADALKQKLISAINP